MKRSPSSSRAPNPNEAEPDPAKPTAVILVGGYSGLGVHTMLNSIRFVPGYFANFVFVSVGVVDSGNFKGSGAVEALREHTQANLAKYVALARSLGMPATSYGAIGTDAVDELEKICLEVSQDFPKCDVLRRTTRLSQGDLGRSVAAQPDGLLAATASAVGRLSDGDSALPRSLTAARQRASQPSSDRLS